MNRFVKAAIVTALMLIVFAVPVTAQESTGEPPTVPTDVPAVDVTPETPAPVEQPNFNLRDFLLGIASGALVALVSMFSFIGKLKNDKVVLDALERLGNSVPADLLLKLNDLGGNMRDAGDVLVKVTDGLPNGAPEPPQPGLVG